MPTESAKVTQRNFPSGQDWIRCRAPSSATCSMRRNRPTTKSTPSRSHISSSRVRTLSAVVQRALRSTATICGARIPKAWKTLRMSSRSSKFSPILVGGRLRPSSKRAVADTGMPPGSEAPVSVVWTSAAVQAMSVPWWKTGMATIWSGLWIPP